jgi:hypothetical protein
MKTRNLLTQLDFLRRLNALPTHMSGVERIRLVGINISLLGSRNPFQIIRFFSSTKYLEPTMLYLFVMRSFASGGRTFAS